MWLYSGTPFVMDTNYSFGHNTDIWPLLRGLFNLELAFVEVGLSSGVVVGGAPLYTCI